MKKFISILALLSFLVPGTVFADVFAETQDDVLGTMRIKSVRWRTEAPMSGDDRLLKVNVDLHYEGELISIPDDYYFQASCRVHKRKRNGAKYLYWEDYTMNEPEVEGPRSFSETFVFRFTPDEWKTVRKRTLDCNISYNNQSDSVNTVLADGIKTSASIKAGTDAWRILRTN